MRHSNSSPDNAIAGLGCIVAISPHLDDAVFSCGELLAAAGNAVVITIFAGAPSMPSTLTQWDRLSGFDDAQRAMNTRRAEDRQALALLGARPQWLDFRDAQYGATPAQAEVADALAGALEKYGADTVLMPSGLFHSDHALVHHAALTVLSNQGGRNWVLYEEALYRRIAGLLQQRLSALLGASIQATPAAFNTGAYAETKRSAVLSYSSQLRALATTGRPGHADLYAPERYWRLASISNHA